MFNLFKITDAGHQPSSPDLMGLLIIQTDDGIFLVDPEQKPHEAPRMLGNTSIINLGGPPFAQFKVPSFKEHHWTIDVTTPFSPGEIKGTWRNGKDAEPADEDNWTAKGTGTGTGTGDDDEARAASATY